MNQRTTLLIASILGFLSVALGAFGAHALKTVLASTGRNETYELAVRYQFYHTLALLGTGILMEKFPRLKTAALLFVIGTVIFCWSLYALALSNETMWGAVTPFGGVFLLVGWLTLGWAMYKNKS